MVNQHPQRKMQCQNMCARFRFPPPPALLPLNLFMQLHTWRGYVVTQPIYHCRSFLTPALIKGTHWFGAPLASLTSPIISLLSPAWESHRANRRLQGPSAFLGLLSFFCWADRNKHSNVLEAQLIQQTKWSSFGSLIFSNTWGRNENWIKVLRSD